jgi:NAD(P)-dependent dehydrogenase (short-subunit alcohol dehydrogenase family)
MNMADSVVVTGATSGIGLVTAIELAKAGYDVIGTARSTESAEHLLTQATHDQVTIKTMLCDVADPASTLRAFTEITTMTGGGPWAVVNNAGYAQAGAVEDVDDEAEVNLVAPARIARLVLPAMRQRRSGRIVNISSVSGRIAVPFIGWYAASKHGLEALSDALRIEVAKFGVHVVLIEPASFGTAIWEKGAATLPNRDASAYRQTYELAADTMYRAATLPQPLPVAQTVLRALQARRPRPRYLVGQQARPNVLLDALLPTRVSDYAKAVATNLRTAPKPATFLVTHLTRRRR